MIGSATLSYNQQKGMNKSDTRTSTTPALDQALAKNWRRHWLSCEEGAEDALRMHWACTADSITLDTHIY